MSWQVQVVETGDLGDRSYVVHDGTTAIVVDPQRDLDRVQAYLDEHGLAVAAVAETHIHNDYVTGGYELARTTGADYVVNAEDPVTFDRVAVTRRRRTHARPADLRGAWPPPATPTPTWPTSSRTPGDGPPAVFTGGSLLYGSVGRTDLVDQAGPRS